jgi:ABC-2 type transport system permease protein
MSIIFTSVFSGLQIIWDRQFGFLKEMLVAPVSRLQIMFGRCLGGATIAVFQGCIVLLLSLIVGFHLDNIWNFFVAVGFMFLTAFLFTLFGTGIASSLKDAQGFQLIINFLVMPIFFLSGALFPIDDLGPYLYEAVKLNPLTYGVDALRGALANLNHFSLMYDFSILVIVIIFFLLVSSYLFSKIEA